MGSYLFYYGFSWAEIDSMPRRIPTGVIRRFLENTRITDKTEGSPMVVDEMDERMFCHVFLK
jgi:hypothetical protein